MEVAGNVVIEIGGNLAPFEAALAKANQMAATFDAQITAKLSGGGLTAGLEKISAGIETTNALLAKLTTSGTAAGTTMARLVTATQPVAAALQQVTVATAATNAELNKIGASAGTASFGAGTISAKEFAAALEATGGNLSKITPAMLGMTAAEDALAASTEAAAVAFRGLTDAQVQAFAAQQEGRNFNLALNESFGLINSTTKSAKESAAVFREMAVAEDAVAVSGRAAAGSMEALGVASGHAAGLGAGVTREFSVLGSEIARGNFSRIPGSLIVMNERLVSSGAGVLTLANGMKALGGLASVIFNPFVLGFLAISLGADVAVRALGSIGSGAKDVNTILKDHKALIEEITAAYPAAAAAAKAYDDQAAQIPTSVAAADTVKQIEEEQKKAKSLLFDLSNSLTVLGNDYAAFGTAGSAAFVKLGEDLKAGNLTASDVQKTLGDLRIDPSLNKNAHEFATWLQESATEAANLELHLAGAVAAGNVFKGSTVGRGDEGANVLANMISAGNAAAEALKKVQDSAGTSGLTSYAKAIANINREFDEAIVKAHASGAALDSFNQARNLSIQEESIKALSSISFDAPIAGANEFGAALTSVGSAAAGVKVELGGMAAPIVNITQLFGKAKLDQLIGLEQATQKFEGLKAEIDDTKNKLAALGNYSVDKIFGNGGTGGASDISGASSAIDQIFKQFDAGTASVRDVHDEIERVRASLIAMHGDNAAVNEFINAIVMGQEKVRQLTGDVQTLGSNIAHLPNKTVTITIKTQQIGSGTQSMYDVPSYTGGGTSSVGVTRYGAAPGSQSGPSVTANQVPSFSSGAENSGSGSSYNVLGGSSTVNVTRFATGGMIHPGDTQSVSFFKSPDETVGIFTPGQMQALADPQSGFNGTQPTANDNRAWTVLMNIEANTRKTADLLDQIKASMASSSSALGGSSSSSRGSSAGSSQFSQYMRVLSQISANFAAAGIVGGGQIGYNSNGLGATPEQIARNLVYGGMSSVGTPTSNGDPFAQGRNYVSTSARAQLSAMNPNDPNYAAAYASVYGSGGFATGGMIAPGDTQEVKFFKSPDEAVAIFTPQQLKAIQGANQNQPAAANTDSGRPIVITQTHNWNGNAPPSKDSIAEMKRQTALAVREAMRSINGR